jgi:hypothetical protein
MSKAMPATAAAAKVPINAAWMKGMDFRNARRMACSRPADCYNTIRRAAGLPC